MTSWSEQITTLTNGQQERRRFYKGILVDIMVREPDGEWETYAARVLRQTTYYGLPRA